MFLAGFFESGTKGLQVSTKKSRKKLKRVIAVRHGEYSDHTGELDDEGVQQMRKLAARIKDLVPKRQVAEIFSSPSVRAMQSAKIIGDLLGVLPAACQSLASDEYEDGNRKMEMLLTARNGSDVIVAITHYESPSGIINAFASRHFQKEVRCHESDNGNGCMLDLKSGAVSLDLLD